MSVVFILGPSEWDPERSTPLRFSPRSVRDRIAEALRAAGHTAFLMEDQETRAGEDMVDKFERLLDEQAVDSILVYWPPAAKMQTTYDELILLRARTGHKQNPQVWVFHHEGVAAIRRGEFKVLERGARSRYLEAVARLGVAPVSWADHTDLYRLVDLFAGEF